MTRSLAMRTLAALGVLALAIGAIFALVLVNVRDERRFGGDTQDTHARVSAALVEEQQVLDLETGLRGYLITGDRTFLEPYDNARASLPHQTARLTALSASDAPSTATARSIHNSIDAYLNDYAIPVASRPPPQTRRERERITAEGKTRMDALRAQFDGFIIRASSESRHFAARAAGHGRTTLVIAVAGLVVSVLLVLLVALFILRSFIAPVKRVAIAARRLAGGDLAARVRHEGSGEMAELATSFNDMAASLQYTRDALERQNTELEGQQAELETALAQLADEKARVERYQRFSTRLAAQNDLRPLADTILEEIGDIAGAEVGALYILPTGTDEALLMTSRGISASWLPAELDAGHGLAGRALAEQRTLAASYGDGGLRVPAFGSSVAVKHELHVPLLQGDRIVGVVTLGRMGDLPFSPKEVETIEYLAERAAVGLSNAIALLVARDQAAINKAVLETAADAFISLDRAGIVRQWNSRAEQMFEFARDDAIGRPLVELVIPREDRERVAEHLRELVGVDREDNAGALEFTAVRSDGSRFPVETTVAPLQLGDVRQLNAFVRDISDRKRDERLEAAHLDVIRALAESPDLDEARLRTLEALGAGLGFDYAASWGPDGDSDRLRCNQTWSAEGFEAPHMDAAAATTMLARGESMAGHVWQSRDPMWAVDLDTTPVFAHRRPAAADNLRSAAAIPIVNGDDFIGVLQLFSSDTRAADPHLIGKLQAIGSQIGEYVARMRAEAEADRLKTEFFALVSHELRTPLTSILGYLELVLEEPGSYDEETGHFLSIVQRNGRRLLRLVDDLLFAAHAEAGEISLDPAPMDLTGVVADAVEAARPRADDKAIVLQLDAERVPASNGDAGRVGQAIDNLISNAIKFTDSGGRVDVELRRDGDAAVISVRDSGMGIAPDEQDRLFDRFFRSERAAEQAVPGVGLGLTIVKAIVEGHGGYIEVASEVGAGTTFTVTLPLRAANEGIAAPAPDAHRAGEVEVTG